MNNQWTCGGGREGLAVDNQKTSSIWDKNQSYPMGNIQGQVEEKCPGEQDALPWVPWFVLGTRLTGDDSLWETESDENIVDTQTTGACKRSTQPTYQRPQILFIRSLCSCLSFFLLVLFFSFFFRFVLGGFFVLFFFSFSFIFFPFLKSFYVNRPFFLWSLKVFYPQNRCMITDITLSS